jgi:ATP-binding cassette, subfamily B (MDR/TAP), member 1
MFTVNNPNIQKAAKAVNVHEFVMSLPQGYNTMLGKNASLISSRQAQRLKIAHALARPAKVLILDECTSVLDPANQAAGLDMVMGVKQGHTTLMVTHKVPVMRVCDRIVLISEGVVRGQGTYEKLMAHKGVFAMLAGGGEWVGK